MSENDEIRENEHQTGQPDRDSNKSVDWIFEEDHLKECVESIQSNISYYEEEYARMNAETKELYDNYRSNNPELHNDLVIGLDMKGQVERLYKKNVAALKKPYFGRIDYTELDGKEQFQLYLGKNGVRRDRVQSLVVDWRAPVASVYYESDIGESSYKTPFGDDIEIQLEKKRTYEISNCILEDFYDSDVVTNDEFLTKYLSKNKEVVLGEIIATIQKEQNQIIRDTPFHSVIVQGVAGSGKTTVAMHRISHILYNYKEKLRADEFFIIGSNKMLLNYITGVLPNLDVYNVNQMTMQDFFLLHLGNDFDLKKSKYTLVDSFLRLDGSSLNEERVTLQSYKGTIDYMKALEAYLKKYERDTVTNGAVIYKDDVIYQKEEIEYFLDFFGDKPLQEKIDLLNKQLIYRITSINELEQQRKEVIKEETKKYKNYFGNRTHKIKLMDIYESFLQHMMLEPEYYLELGIHVAGEKSIELLQQNLKDRNLDLYDLGMLVRIKKQLKMTQDFEFVSHIVVDEAQDFGVVVFYLLKQLFKSCTYTIMGDVSQNIHYDSGMNDWEDLTQQVFHPIKDKFYVLAKSYRNTVEISNFASKILKQCSFKTYEIQPIIRHGMEVSLIPLENEEKCLQKTLEMIKSILERGYDTVAIICRTVEEMRHVQEMLKAHIQIHELPEEIEDMTFINGVMVLPIHMTKGLEFDAVIIWNPEETNYMNNDGDAKLMYVAITRAMHELHIPYYGSLSRLLQEK